MAFTRKAAIGLLRRAHDQKRLGHAYLISGPAGSGKREVAAELASTVNGTDAGDVFSSKAREIFVAEPESKSRRILIEQIRELEHGLQMRGAEGRRKVAIIAEADRLQPQAANAFLKTLEEPPANSLLLLLSALPEALPDTIVSRCICIPLAANGEKIDIPERSELIDLLRAAAREKEWGIQQPYRVAQGMQALLGQMREEIKTQTAESLKEEDTRYRNSTDGAWLEGREEYYKALSESLYIQRRAMKRRRRGVGLSQAQLAQRAGLHRTYVSDLERGARNPSIESIEKLAHALHLSVLNLFEAAGGNPT